MRIPVASLEMANFVGGDPSARHIPQLIIDVLIAGFKLRNTRGDFEVLFESSTEARILEPSAND